MAKRLHEKQKAGWPKTGDLPIWAIFSPEMQRLSGLLREVVVLKESNHRGPLLRRGPGTSTL